MQKFTIQGYPPPNSKTQPSSFLQPSTLHVMRAVFHVPVTPQNEVKDFQFLGFSQHVFLTVNPLHNDGIVNVNIYAPVFQLAFIFVTTSILNKKAEDVSCCHTLSIAYEFNQIMDKLTRVPDTRGHHATLLDFFIAFCFEKNTSLAFYLPWRLGDQCKI